MSAPRRRSDRRRDRVLVAGLAVAACAAAGVPLAADGSPGRAPGDPEPAPTPTWTPGTLAYPPPPDNPKHATMRHVDPDALPAAARGKITPIADRERFRIVRSADPRCRNGWMTIGMRNATHRAVYGGLTAEAGALRVSRPVFATYLPPAYEARIQFRITAPPEAAAGGHRLVLRAGKERLTVPVALDEPGPGEDNLACGRPVAASSANTSGRPDRYPAASVTDGNLNAEEFGVGNGWNDSTARRWPDTLEVDLGGTRRVARVVVHTLASNRYPPSRYGLRDWDVQARADGAWTTVARSRANTAGRVEHSFAPVEADALRIVCLGSNDRRFSRIIELEAFGPAR
ncbi:discoidin domain-containing protein [Actinomadura rugatobispora]|uniref:Discoidin domain-containing protein n=1 Tax=Actinomadura rugatobispora TaxID=1994 RepID=A0ABW1A3R4_9ACTN|nr:hypothetical protein GCM10010200_070890 [Actinomadura rugatobispora]